MVRFRLLLLMLVAGPLFVKAQDTLPKFSATTTGTKVIVSWVNPNPNVTQISIQRSLDSLKNFKTILTVPDPTVLQNGFVDNKSLPKYNYYRLFIVYSDGNYEFSKSKKAYWDTLKKVIPSAPNPRIQIDEPEPTKPVAPAVKPDTKVVDSSKLIKPKQPEIVSPKPAPPPPPERYLVIKKRDTVLYSINEKVFKPFRDSIANKTKDTLVYRGGDTIFIRPFIPREVYKPSIYVFTDKDGNITINLPQANQHHYSLKIFEETGEFLFEIKTIKDSPLILDKSNFLKAGWYKFELYEDGKLKEKNKFQLLKDF